mmetsp:Transcript_30703/g.117475  ORF Transcript_30703/g.117475 Transcript_30703/m.117475 type:complete len:84 (+) Transcript_30703:1022-1273(+)
MAPVYLFAAVLKQSPLVCDLRSFVCFIAPFVLKPAVLGYDFAAMLLLLSLPARILDASGRGVNSLHVSSAKRRAHRDDIRKRM